MLSLRPAALPARPPPARSSDAYISSGAARGLKGVGALLFQLQDGQRQLFLKRRPDQNRTLTTHRAPRKSRADDDEQTSDHPGDQAQQAAADSLRLP